MSIPTPDQRREATAARLRAIIEWISNDLGDHARAVELDNAVHDLEVHAIRVGVPYRPPRYDHAARDATCRHHEAWLPAPSYLEQETWDG